MTGPDSDPSQLASCQKQAQTRTVPSWVSGSAQSEEAEGPPEGPPFGPSASSVKPKRKRSSALWAATAKDWKRQRNGSLNAPRRLRWIKTESHALEPRKNSIHAFLCPRPALCLLLYRQTSRRLWSNRSEANSPFSGRTSWMMVHCEQFRFQCDYCACVLSQVCQVGCFKKMCIYMFTKAKQNNIRMNWRHSDKLSHIFTA